MTTEETIKNNVLIALFMGWEIDNSFPDKERTYRKGSGVELDTTFKYHLSWDLIMTAVDKIESLGYHSCIEYFGEYRVYFNHDSIGIRSENKLITTYLAVVDFIEWYNEQNK